ncbi:MAG TPA: hypothetical protein VLE70_14580 [Anaerolineae bacterium]|nr:hypothetical protein [Anaerolineae bacterium]
MNGNNILPKLAGQRLAWSLPPIFILLALSLLLAIKPAGAQEGGAVQEIFGRLEVDGGDLYRLPDLQRGQVLYLYAESVGGNLDPFMLLADGDEDAGALQVAYRTQLAQAIAAGEDPVLAIPQIIGDWVMAWDDDSGRGYDAAIVIDIPADGDYLLSIATAPTADTFGQYRLLIGLDAPEVLDLDAQPTGDTIAVVDTSALLASSAVQQITGTLTTGRISAFHELNQLAAGETLYAYVEATSGDLKPVLILEDFAGKAIRSGNFAGQETSASLEFTAPEILENYELNVEAFGQGSSRTSGDYRLIVGRNAPEVLDGVADVRGDPILQAAIPVQVGLKLQQITDVDQQAENFGAVATIQMRWNDPKLAFNPDECQCDLRTFRTAGFSSYVSERSSLWPEFTVFNQQGRRDTQNDNVVVWPNGDALYLERFSATLQAPDFDFRRFPFDTQRFYIRLDSLFPEEFFLFEKLPEYSELGDQLGEEEWVVLDFDTEIDSSTASSTLPVSRFSFGFTANRHLSFYVIRIFVPIFIIIMVSWFTFFLKDYNKRVDVTAGNLLLFIAFNFTISGELPRLGYLTFLDTILISTFAVTAMVVAFNVVLRRLELSGRSELAQRIDRYTLWIYPVAYVAAISIVALLFT